MKKEPIREELLHLLHSYNANSAVPKQEADFDSTLSTLESSASTLDTSGISNVSENTGFNTNDEPYVEEGFHIVEASSCQDVSSGKVKKEYDTVTSQEDINISVSKWVD